MGEPRPISSRRPLPRKDAVLPVMRANDEPGEVLRVTLRPTRSRVHQVSVGSGRAEQVGRALTDLVYEFEFEGRGPLRSVTLSGAYEGEPLSLAEAQWLTRDGRDDAPEPVSTKTWARGRRLAVLKAFRVGGEFTGDEPLDGEVLRSMAPASGEAGLTLLATSFFTELDLRSNDRLIDQTQPWAAERLEDVEATTSTLLSRLAARLKADMVFADPPAAPDPATLDVEPLDRVQRLADLQTGLMAEYYPDPDGTGLDGIDVGAVQSAFEAFATGTLAPCLYRAGPDLFEAQPDSTNLFCWGEFALLALDVGVPNDVLWKRLSRTLTSVQRLFLLAYGYRATGCSKPLEEKLGILGWLTRGPPVRDVADTPELQDEYWRQLVRDIHFSNTAHLPLLHAQHLAMASSDGVPV
jgi:hypothetical protein